MKSTDTAKTPAHRQVAGASRDAGAEARPDLDRVLPSDPLREAKKSKPAAAGQASN